MGAYEVRARDYAIAAVGAESIHGIAYGLGRNSPIGAIIEGVIAPHYLARPIEEPRQLFESAWAAHPTVLTSGLGLRALSIVDLAAWDLAAKLANKTMVSYLGGKPVPLVEIALIGYPPNSPPDAIASEVRELHRQGWTRFKMPIGPTLERTRNRLQAVRDVAGGADLMLDAAWTWRNAPEAADYVTQLADLGLGWVEDPFLPGDAANTAALRQAVSTPIAVGDEQGGGYFPEALLQAKAIDVLRLDATCSGGVSTFSDLLRRARESGVRVSTHIYHQVHQALLCGFAESGATVECGHGNGIDPLSEALLMNDGPGFGFSPDLDRVGPHDLHDPAGIFTSWS